MNDEIRRAASLIVGREGPVGLELLLLERGGDSRFLPGYVAFPGGSIDPGDADLATRWWNAPEESGRACALRELAEEAGLVLTASGMIATASGGALDESPPEPGRLVEVAHWVAPERVPVRFDARFYAVGAPTSLEPTADGVESSDAWWDAPSALLEDWDAGKRKLYWPTYFTMRQLATCGSVAELLAIRIDTREPDEHDVERLPRSVFWQD